MCVAFKMQKFISVLVICCSINWQQLLSSQGNIIRNQKSREKFLRDLMQIKKYDIDNLEKDELSKKAVLLKALADFHFQLLVVPPLH